jgi:hexosaminidase
MACAFALPALSMPPPLPPPLVPKPVLIEAHEGAFTLDERTKIFVDSTNPELARTAHYLADRIAEGRGMHLEVVVRPGAPEQGSIVLRLDEKMSAYAAEGYALEVEPGRIVVSAPKPHGVFNGAMSLLQIATNGPATADSVPVPAVLVQDYPRFEWRGLMLDSARHLQSVDEIKRFLDEMALHKLSVMQWHLTDDQGWRLQIRKYPKLTDVGAWRQPAGAAGIDAEGKAVRYGGFYTQAQVRDIVRYAAERYITVVPEIDMPGHAQAAIAAYPQLGTTGRAPPVSPDWGVHEYLFNVEPGTIGFLEDVLTETMELFPSKFIHVGGDEAVKTQWQNSPAVQARMKALGIADETRLQAWLTAHMQAFLAKHGRRLIGWDEILEGGLPADAAVMSWRGTDGAIAATKAGHDSVLSPWPLLYFDNRQGTGANEPPGRIRVVSLEDVYKFDPLPPAMTKEQGEHLLGVQGNLWSEHIRTAERVDWMAFPRGAAIAEMGWTAPAGRLWFDFTYRLPGLYASYAALGVRAADSPYAVSSKVDYAAGKATIALSTQLGAADSEVHYTLDGSEPTMQSPRFREPLSLELPATVRAAGFAKGRRLSQVLELPLRRELAQRRRAGQLKLCSENIALGLEDDGPAQGPRAIFPIDIQNPCWIFPGADLDTPVDFSAAVGNVPFNFQIGDLVDKIVFAKPRTKEGELLVLLDQCEGEELARIPLVSAVGNSGVTTLPAAPLRRVGGKHDLCLRFAQPALQPVWALDWVQLTDSKR